MDCMDGGEDMPLTKSEQETHLWAGADEDHWQVFTEDRKVITLLKNRGWVPDKVVRGSYWFIMPRKAVTIRSRDSVMNPKARGKGGLNR